MEEPNKGSCRWKEQHWLPANVVGSFDDCADGHMPQPPAAAAAAVPVLAVLVLADGGWRCLEPTGTGGGVAVVGFSDEPGAARRRGGATSGVDE